MSPDRALTLCRALHQELCVHYLVLLSPHPCEVGAITAHIFQVSKLQLRQESNLTLVMWVVVNEDGTVTQVFLSSKPMSLTHVEQTPWPLDLPGLRIHSFGSLRTLSPTSDDTLTCPCSWRPSRSTAPLTPRDFNLFHPANYLPNAVIPKFISSLQVSDSFNQQAARCLHYEVLVPSPKLNSASLWSLLLLLFVS